MVDIGTLHSVQKLSTQCSIPREPTPALGLFLSQGHWQERFTYFLMEGEKRGARRKPSQPWGEHARFGTRTLLLCGNTANQCTTMLTYVVSTYYTYNPVKDTSKTRATLR